MSIPILIMNTDIYIKSKQSNEIDTIADSQDQDNNDVNDKNHCTDNQKLKY